MGEVFRRRKLQKLREGDALIADGEFMALMLLAPEIIIYGPDPTRLQGSQSRQKIMRRTFSSRCVAYESKTILLDVGYLHKGFA